MRESDRDVSHKWTRNLTTDDWNERQRAHTRGATCFVSQTLSKACREAAQLLPIAHCRPLQQPSRLPLMTRRAIGQIWGKGYPDPVALC